MVATEETYIAELSYSLKVRDNVNFVD